MKVRAAPLMGRRGPGLARSRAGFSLLEVAVSLTLLSLMMTSLLMVWRAEAQRAQARLAGQQYRMHELALTDYLGLYHAQLLSLPADCGQVALAADRSLPSSASVAAGACRLRLPLANAGTGQVDVANGMQPKLEELQALRLIDATLRVGLVLPTVSVVAQPSEHQSGTEPVAARLAMRIEKACADGPCRNFLLTGLIFNTQPYDLARQRSGVDGLELAQDALAGAGPQAALSEPVELGGDGELVGWQGAFSVTNPLRTWSQDGASTGLPGILGVRVSLGNARLGGLAMADGSHQTMGNWDFRGHEVTGLRSVRSEAAELGQVQAQGLKVSGQATVKDLQVDSSRVSSLSVDRLNLPRAVTGGPCDGAAESLALAADGSAVLVCRGGAWFLSRSSSQ
jgi:type II secretory pathway pseudopilin PulG